MKFTCLSSVAPPVISALLGTFWSLLQVDYCDTFFLAQDKLIRRAKYQSFVCAPCGYWRLFHVKMSFSENESLQQPIDLHKTTKEANLTHTRAHCIFGLIWYNIPFMYYCVTYTLFQTDRVYQDFFPYSCFCRNSSSLHPLSSTCDATADV